MEDPAGRSDADVTGEVLSRVARTADPRLRELVSAAVRHLHAFATETGLTPAEWAAGIAFLTEVGRMCTPERQEYVLLSDTLGLSTLVDALDHARAVATGGDLDPTESSVLGPFYVPGSPPREYGASIAEQPAGDPTFVSGRVRDRSGRGVADAELDVWQNGDNMRYAVQDPAAPPAHLRGRFRTRADGSFAFLGVRPTDYPIPDDGPVGRLLAATGRHPWRPAHIHLIVRAPGHRTLTTHFFDAESPYLDSDAVIAVKPSLVRRFTRHDPGSADRPAGVGAEQVWYRTELDIVLSPAVEEIEQLG